MGTFWREKRTNSHVQKLSFKFHKGSRVVAAGILEYIDNTYSVVTITTCKGGEIEANKQFAKVHEVLEKLFPTDNNPARPWHSKVSVLAENEWTEIKSGSGKRPSNRAAASRFSRTWIVKNAVNTQRKEHFPGLIPPRTQEANHIELPTHSRDNSHDIEEGDLAITSETSDSPGEPALILSWMMSFKIPTRIQFSLSQRPVVEGELLFVDSQHSVVLLDRILDDEVAPQVKKLKGGSVDWLLDQLHPSKVRWDKNVEIKIDGVWRMFGTQKSGQPDLSLTRRFFVTRCKNEYTHKEALDFLKEDNETERQETADPVTKRGRTETTEASQETVEPVSKRSRIETVVVPPPSASSPPTQLPMANDPVGAVIAKLKAIDDAIKESETMIAKYQQEVNQNKEEKRRIQKLFDDYFRL